jgi:hypothetical protein
MILLVLLVFKVQAQKDSIEISELEKKELRVLANQIATKFTIAKEVNNKNLVIQVNELIENYLDLNHSENNKKEILIFWNTKSQYLICDTGTKKSRESENILKRAIYLKLYPEMFFSYLMSFKDPTIDFNAIEVVDGKNETILDYIDNIMEEQDVELNYNASQVRKLRKILATQFGAKKASELEK